MRHETTHHMILLVFGAQGLTTVGKLLSERLGSDWLFFDADDYHSAENKAKMSEGQALSDEDRGPWLESLEKLILDTQTQAGRNAVLACSALKRTYRQRLFAAAEGSMKAVYLFGEFDVFHSRMLQRADHFMKANMLATQFEALEEPKPDPWSEAPFPTPKEKFLHDRGISSSIASCAASAPRSEAPFRDEALWVRNDGDVSRVVDEILCNLHLPPK
eukprot:CAMPEP_0196652212 /NCGR_PEP_ID=MMETSP1086-20130531/1444_1 /TAXON_ID=77921 /ORGANISM="Cyanoptyche  gloeocystis , Strain SAG4.97" /LENGTH=216 /DNA_ID=CAMNT_0041982633 /DNA_START=23 /DNA_END=674 /DNA_ORIENTATION=+